MSTAFNPELYEFVKVKGSMITAKRGLRAITRNASFFKKFLNKQDKKDEFEYDEEIGGCDSEQKGNRILAE